MKTKRNIKKYILILLNLITIILLGITTISCSPSSSKEIINKDNLFIVHYIDVGQGDSILIQVNDKNMLIDAGPKSNKDDIINYLNSQKIEKLDYVIATHPHEDHIGNMADIIKKYTIVNFYAPKVTHTSKIFENMIDALKEKDMKIKVIREGTNTINLGENTNVSVYAPVSNKYDDLNNYSPIIKISYKNNSFLFTGDAEKLSEDEVLNKSYNLKADVLKVGHHGSSSSTSNNFLKEVTPSIAVIMVGNDNDYGHPNKETLNSLKNKNIKIYRTDLDKTIILYSDGNNVIKY